jgi:hypothetical protein
MVGQMNLVTSQNPATLQIVKEFFKRLNVFSDKKNWLVVFKLVAGAGFGAVFSICSFLNISA